MFGIFFSFIASHILYLALHLETGSFPRPLTPRQEVEAFEAFKKGDMAARDRIIRHNLRLVAHVVKKYYSLPGDAEDLISIGTIGLIKAVSTFDYSKGTKFATYASRCIENEILMHFRSRKKSAHDLYLSDAIDTDKDGNSITWSDVLPDDINILDDVDLRLQSEQMYRFIKLLPKREQTILTLRYGLYGTQPLTQREVAQQLDISRSYVSRLEKKALATLSDYFS